MPVGINWETENIIHSRQNKLRMLATRGKKGTKDLIEPFSDYYLDYSFTLASVHVVVFSLQRFEIVQMVRFTK